MNKKKVLLSVVLSFAFLAFVFTNCSRVGVTDLQDTSQTLAETMGSSSELAPVLPSENPPSPVEPLAIEIPLHADEAPENEEAYIPSKEEEESLVETLPPQNESEPQPVTELIENPDLFQVYKCPNSDDKVMICHFPQGTNPPNTQCVGSQSVSTHFGHTRIVAQSDGSSKTWIDYLGPCR